MPDPVHIVDVDDRNRLIEFLVDKRVKGLEYLRKFHLQDEDQLWMGTICIGKSDIFSYFDLDRSLLVQQMAPFGSQQPNPARVGSDQAVIFFDREVTVSGKSAAPVKPAAADASSVYTIVTPAPIEGLESRASAAWLRDNMRKWYLLGLSSANLMMLPLSGPQYVDALFQLLLEMEHFFASGASKMLAGRALKAHKLDVHVRSASAAAATAADGGAESGFVGSPGSGGAMGAVSSPSMSGMGAASSPAAGASSASAGGNSGGGMGNASGVAGGSAAAAASAMNPQPTYTYLQVDQLPGFLPSYDAVVPSLCSTLVFVYRKLYDFDVIESVDSVKRVLAIDKRLKTLFFGNLSKEIGAIARYKVMQQYQLLRDSVFAAFSQAGDETIDELVRGAQSIDATVVGDPTAAGGGGAGPRVAASVGGAASARPHHHADPAAASSYFSDDD